MLEYVVASQFQGFLNGADCVGYSIILKRVSEVGVGRTVLGQVRTQDRTFEFCSFLLGRLQNGECSSTAMAMAYRSPQGSEFSPIL